MFGNKLLRNIFRAKRVEITGHWRTLHNGELQSNYSLPNIIRNIKSRRLRWAGDMGTYGKNAEMHTV